MVAAGLLLTIHFYAPPTSGLWLKELFDSAHVLAFGLISLSILASITSRKNFLERAAIALGVSMLLGILSEAAQIPVSRDASWHDLMSDWFGSAAFLGFATAFSRQASVTRRLRVAVFLLSLALLAWALRPITMTSLAYLERYRQLPVLVQFESRLTDKFMRRQNATVVRAGSASTPSIKVELLDAAWPGITFHDIWPDWRDYSAIVLELGIEGDSPFDLNLRIHDRKHVANGQVYSDRYNTQFRLDPGSHELLVDLEDVRNAPRGRELDLSQVAAIILFGRKEDAGRVIELKSIRLVD